MPSEEPLAGVACQAARRLLNLSQDDLHGLSGVSKRTINDIENGFARPRPSTLDRLRSTLEAAGANFVVADGLFGVRVSMDRARFEGRTRSPKRRAAPHPPKEADGTGAPARPARRRGRPRKTG